MDKLKGRIHFSDVILFIIFLLLLALPGYLCYQVIVQKNTSKETTTTSSNTSQESNKEENNVQEETPVVENPYVDFTREVEEQTAYIAVPTKIDTNNPPAIILYSHGSDVQVIADMNDPDMLDLQSYGKYFASQNYIFAASNEHGANWGSTDSVDDMQNLENWVKAHYITQEKVYLIGHSMGGLPTMHFALKYPENVYKIALLAPTTRTYEWNQENVDIIKDIPIQIWHGSSDVNISLQSSIDFVSYMQNLGKNINLIQLQGKNHNDVKTGYKDQILTFFKSTD
jgi:predicted peptidase